MIDVILGNENPFERSAPRGIEPRFICQPDGLNNLEQRFLDDLSYRVVNEQQRLTVIFPMTIVAFSLLNSSTITTNNRFVSLEQIYTDKRSLFVENSRVLEHFSSTYQLYWPSDNNQQHLTQRLLSVYQDVFDISGDQRLVLKMTGDRLNDTALLMKLIMYRNTCLHLFAKPAFILLACQSNVQVNDSIFTDSIAFQTLQTVDTDF